MDPREINDASSLRAWLSDKPADWAQAIALRAALRALPYIASADERWLAKFALLPFGALLTSWMQLVDNSIFVRNDENRANARFGGESFDFELYKGQPTAASAADASYHSADAQSGSLHVVSDCVEAVVNAADAIGANHHIDEGYPETDYAADDAYSARQRFWRTVATDCVWIQMQRNTTMAIRRFICIPLSRAKYSPQLAKQLLAIDSNYSVWIDWYERRIQGKRAAFAIPGDKRRSEDKEILRRLAKATDKDFWGKGHEHVNATLKGWLDEARESVRSWYVPAPNAQGITTGPPEIGSPKLSAVQPLPLPQNRNVLSFKSTPEGQIAIDATAHADGMRRDSGARDRHAEAVALAQAWLNLCRGNNAAARLTRFLEDYLVAAGDEIGAAKPSLLVLRGERLRQEISRYEAADNMLAPISDELLLEGRGVVAAHNMMVALDPVLNANDTAMLGPDRQPVLIAPDEFREKVRDADTQGLFAEGVVEIIDEAASLAPQIPDPANRLSVSFGGMAQNLIIEAFACAFNHPRTSVVTIGAAGAMSSGLAAGAIGSFSILGSIKTAEYLVQHREWIVTRFGNAPTWQTLIERLVDWLEEVTPFKPK